MHERHSYRLIRDLFDHKEEIFGELKRASSANHTLAAPTNPRPRAPSTDESNRRANMEARNRAIVSKSRATSPAPSATVNGRGHRRDRSSGGPERRFPIQTSPPANVDAHKRGIRHSLEVPGEIPPTAEPPSNPVSAEVTHSKPMPEPSTTNGVSENTVPASAVSMDGARDTAPVGVEKKNSLGRTGHVAAAANRLNRKTPGSGSGSGLGMIARHAVKRDSVGSLNESSRASGEIERAHGVELTDKPMDF